MSKYNLHLKETFLNEASLSRIWRHYENKTPFALLSAFRSEYPYEENKRRNTRLAADIRKKGYGYFFADGYWIENKGTKDEVHVSEDTIFVVGKKGKEQDFLNFIVNMVRKYDQEAALVYINGEAALYNSKGEKTRVYKKLRPGMMGDVYTRLRHKNPETNVFVFESERDAPGFFEMMMKAE